MPNSSIDGYDLPAQTKYVVDKPKRSEYQPTYVGGQFDDKGELITQDFSINLTISDTTRTVYEALLALHDANSSYAFIGHQDTVDDTWTIRIEDLGYEVDAGLYQLTMKLRVIS